MLRCQREKKHRVFCRNSTNVVCVSLCTLHFFTLHMNCFIRNFTKPPGMSVTLLTDSGSIAEIAIHVVGAANSKGRGNGGKRRGRRVWRRLIYVSFRKSTHPQLECETNKFQAKQGASVRLKSNLPRSLIINQSARREAENQIVANRITRNMTPLRAPSLSFYSSHF